MQMTKEVTVTISGLQWGADIGQDNIETVTGAEYFKKNDSHYLLYEETMEGFSRVSKNRIKFKSNILELTRQGLMNTHMIFEEKKKHMTNYVTPYGSLLLGIQTQKVLVEEMQDCITVSVEYVLDMDGEPLSENRIELRIKERPCAPII